MSSTVMGRGDGRVKSIVFGGSGFLGSHVADELTERGHDVIVYDIRSSDYLREGQQMVVGDILDADAVMRAAKDCDFVFNFAGIADLDSATTRPVDTARSNILGNLNIMEAAVAAGARRFVYASTVYVYSQKGGFYRCSKQSSEVFVEEYERRFGLEYTVLRYGTLYGPRATDKNSIYRYLRQAVDDKRIECSGTGDEMREYVYVRDAAKMSVDILEEKYRNRHIIITGHNPMKFREMLLMIREILGDDVEIEFSVEEYHDHYSYTPYSWTPRIGHKLVDTMYMDMGQGLLECLQDIYGADRLPGTEELVEE